MARPPPDQPACRALQTPRAALWVRQSFTLDGALGALDDAFGGAIIMAVDLLDLFLRLNA